MMENSSVVTFITLSTVDETTVHRIAIFTITLVFYSLVLFVNISIIAVVVLDPSLREPMYIFLCVICLNEIYGTTGFYPKFLSLLLYRSNRISYQGCLLQAYMLFSFGLCEMSLLMLMAYDRYLAICRPLHYHAFMTPRRLSLLVLLSWLTPISVCSANIALTSLLKLCSSEIHKMYCVNRLIIELACPEANTTPSIILSTTSMLVYACQLFFIIWSYARIAAASVRSKNNRVKFMQTCVPHLLSLTVFVSVLLFDVFYLNFVRLEIPQGLKNLITIKFLLFPPLMNPLIYGIKLTRIRHRILYIVHGKKK